MGNLGSGELLVIFFVALLVLGPNKLPDAARQVGRAVNEIRRVSGGFQREMREAMREPMRAAEQAKADMSTHGVCIVECVCSFVDPPFRLRS